MGYIHPECASAVEPVLARIEASLETLAHHPGLGRSGRAGGTRELLVLGTAFILAYRHKTDRLEILALVRGARRWPDTFGLASFPWKWELPGSATGIRNSKLYYSDKAVAAALEP